MTAKSIDHKDILSRISRYLMLHGSFTGNPGLLNGKMGVILFFYELFRYTGKKVYEDFAGELLDEVYKEITKETPLNFKKGLCGIGWAIAYLMRNNFLTGDPDDVFVEIDRRIVEWDVRKIDDYSLETGLAGIACYVMERKVLIQSNSSTPSNSPIGGELRNNGIITDDYCRDLVRSLNKNHETVFLAEMLERILNGETIDFYNPLLETVRKIKYNEKTLFEKSKSKGIANNGIAGIGLKLIADSRDGVYSVSTTPHSLSQPKIYLFTKTSRAANYGIGTYIDNLITVLKSSGLPFGIVHIHAEGNEAKISEKDGYEYISIPSAATATNFKYYDRNVAYLLRELIPENKNFEYIFHLNIMESVDFVRYLKRMFKCKVIQAVHYIDWSFKLFGNVSRFRNILAKTTTCTGTEKKLYSSIRESYRKEKKMLDRVDHAVCLSENTRQIMEKDYRMESHKLSVIYNGLSDSRANKENEATCKKYGLPDVPVILFTGRLDEIKGLKYAIQAFRTVLKTLPHCRMIVAGNGSFDTYLKECEDIWPSIIFTGLIDRQHLYELYSIADIGVMPSFHEQCSYVAIEMMMHGIPLIASTSTGLDEMVEEGVSGLHISVIEHSDKTEINASLLAEKMLYLLQNLEERKRMGMNARKRFLEKYELSVFRKKMLHLYENT